MKVFSELLTTPSGLLVLGVLLFMVAMGVYLTAWVRWRIAEDLAKK